MACILTYSKIVIWIICRLLENKTTFVFHNLLRKSDLYYEVYIYYMTYSYMFIKFITDYWNFICMGK